MTNRPVIATAAPRVLALLAVGLLFLLSVVIPAPPACAHDVLIRSVPADGETYTEYPARIELEFMDDIIPASPALLIQDAEQEVVWEVTPDLEGRIAIAAFPVLPDGEYRLNWSLVSADGHRQEGTIPFELSTGLISAPAETGPTTAPAEVQPPSPTPGPTPDPTDAETSVEAATEAPSSPPTDEPGGLAGLSLPAKIGIGVGALAAAGTVAVLILRRRDGELGS